MEARIQARPPSMPDQILRCFKCPKVLIAFPYRIVLFTAIVAVCHQHGDLSAQLRQLERACIPVSLHVESKSSYSVQAIAVIVAPAVAPASPKHVIVDRVGHAPFVFAITSGELPVA